MSNKCKNFRKGNNQTGITLVALVVTIVILLILAGVSISLILDNNGIITKAGEARDKNYIEAIKEAREMWNTEKYLGAIKESLADYLYNKGVITEEEKIIVENKETITKGKYSVNFAVKTVAEAFLSGELQVGDWVNYENPTTVSADVKATDSNYSDTGYTSPHSKTGMESDDGTEGLDQTYSLTNNGKTVNWRILGLSDDGRLMLTTGSPLQRDYNTSEALSDENNPYFWLRGAKGTSTEYGLKELNKICAIYKNNLADEVRSITIDDINGLCEVIVDITNKKVTRESDVSTDINQWGTFGISQTYENQFESPEAYITDPTDTGKTASFEKTSDAYYYEGSDAIDSTSALYDILFARTGQDGSDRRWYWLASYAFEVGCRWAPGSVDRGEAYSYIPWFIQNGYWFAVDYAVRPVVYLKPDVTIDELQKVDTPTSGEEAWDYRR